MKKFLHLKSFRTRLGHPYVPLLIKILLTSMLIVTFPLMGKGDTFEEINTLQHKKEYAIGGYDTVAYFTFKRPTEGAEEFRAQWKNATWLFVNKAHLNKFKANPEKYAPQYGGYCAWAIAAKKKLYSIEPDQWNVVNGKLYLNFNKKIKTKWEKKQATFIRQADVVWKKLVKNG